MKKKLTYLLAAAFVFSCNRSAQVSIAGCIDTADGAMVTIIGKDPEIKYDSVIVRGGKFKVNTTVPKNGFFFLDFKYGEPYKEYIGWHKSILFYAEDGASYNLSARGPQDIMRSHVVLCRCGKGKSL